MAASGVDNKLREVQRICEKAGEAASTTVIKVIDFVRDGAKTRRKNVKLPEQNTVMQVDLAKGRAAGFTRRSQYEAIKCHVTALKWQMTNARAAQEKLPCKTSQIKVDP